MIDALESLRLSDFDYHLPEELIAQEPAAERDRSRLMVIDRRTGYVLHRIFSDLENILLEGDLLVLNNTRVFPCRLEAKKKTGGRVEIFLTKEIGPNFWEALLKGGIRTGGRLMLSSGIEAEVVSEGEEGIRTVRFYGVRDIREILPSIGKTPLPPYIRRRPSQQDAERYQTVYASNEGAVAAPTAGLHFTEELLSRLRKKGVETVYVTLHVGPGTFQPVRADIITEHRMHEEQFIIPEQTAESINLARREGRRVIAVGTTSARAVETAAEAYGTVRAGEGGTNLFIYPGYRFKATDAMITNFHLPRSTLLMLVAAFGGIKNILSAYEIAVAERYRFYSYGDAMLIL